MSLIEYTLDGKVDKVEKAIARFRSFTPEEGYCLEFSGGKDSTVIKALADLAGVKYDAHYRVSSVDPPELVRFIKEKHPDVARDVPRYADGTPITMWNLIPKKLMPPTRIVRYCCSMIKESQGTGRLVVTGVRWAESASRAENHGLIMSTSKSAAKIAEDAGADYAESKKGGIILNNDNDAARRMVESCYAKHKTLLNPIIDWTNDDVWEFIRVYGCSYCGVYDEGFKRLGCIGCPMAGKKGREREFARWPAYKKLYLSAFDKMLQVRRERDKPCEWETPQDVFNWWMECNVLPGQYDLFSEEYTELAESMWEE